MIDSPLGKVAIYENGVTIPARLVPVRLPKGSQSPLVVSVRDHVCNDTGRCLLPSTIRTEVPVALPFDNGTRIDTGVWHRA